MALAKGQGDKGFVVLCPLPIRLENIVQSRFRPIYVSE